MLKQKPTKESPKVKKSTLPAASNNKVQGNASTAKATPKSRFSPEEEARIKAEVEAYQTRQRETEIQEEIRNRILDSKS